MKESVAVALSGGVDSAVAAALLKESGYEVIAVTMRYFCGQDIGAARQTAEKLKIKHYTLDMRKALTEKVISNFCREYLAGRTPNPCVRCNQYIKFGLLLRKAYSLGAELFATGHYARIVKEEGAGNRGQVYLLKKAKDLKKDQSYFLYSLSQSQLKRIIFPLGDYTKEEVRALARKFKLKVADRPASQEICFLKNKDYRQFIRRRYASLMKAGDILDKQGNILGHHQGVSCYTIGQRQGLGVSGGYPLYVISTDPLRNQVTLGARSDVLRKEFLLKGAHFIYAPLWHKKKVACQVRIRYNHQEDPAQLIRFKKRIKVIFRKAQFAVTPGQSAVFYDQDIVLGGGIIA
jgi:tRNA-specific 2-thiouridylase